MAIDHQQFMQKKEKLSVKNSHFSSSYYNPHPLIYVRGCYVSEQYLLCLNCHYAHFYIPKQQNFARTLK